MAIRDRTITLRPPALATRVDVVPSGAEWQHEPKIDGYRLQCHVQARTATLLSRNGIDYTARFPRVADAAVALLGGRSAILDGEVVVPVAGGRSPFQSLQLALTSGVVETAQFWVFDLLQEGRSDLRPRVLRERRTRLEALIGEGNDVIQVTPLLRGRPETLLAAACKRKEEGVISKRRDAPYRPGRGRDWLKIKCGNRDEFVIIGFSEPEGARTHFGALLLASRGTKGRPLQYAGRVGTGFSDAVLADLYRQMQPLQRDTPPVTVPRTAARRVHWVEPVLVADVAFAEWTSDRILRQPSFEGLRDDKGYRDVRREVVVPATKVTGQARSKATSPASATRVAGVTISHGDRVIFPEIRLTKHGLAEFYEAVAPRLLPHVARRPLSTLRCPDGPHAACFFQKHWKATRGAAVRTVPVDEADGDGGEYAVAQTAHDLVALVQWNVIELHPWASRSDALESPDRLILDLDPGPGVGWKTLREAARRVRTLLDAAELQSWIKLSGGKGVHIVVPFQRRISWRQLSDLARLIAGRLVHDHPTTFVDVAAKDRRTRRIFVDWLRNSRGATAAAPWSVRARKNAPVSVPIAWDDLDQVDAPDAMAVPVVRELLASNPADPWADLAGMRQRLTATVLDALTPSGH